MTLAGYLVFDNFPDRYSLIGIAIIMASGIYIARSQHISDRAQVAELRAGPPGQLTDRRVTLAEQAFPGRFVV